MNLSENIERDRGVCSNTSVGRGAGSIHPANSMTDAMEVDAGVAGEAGAKRNASGDVVRGKGKAVRRCRLTSA